MAAGEEEEKAEGEEKESKVHFEDVSIGLTFN